VVEHGVLHCRRNQPAGLVAADASALYARNVLDFLKLVIDKEGGLADRPRR
jgi:NAD(P) transhydrogenase subunit alpha